MANMHQNQDDSFNAMKEVSAAFSFFSTIYGLYLSCRGEEIWAMARLLEDAPPPHLDYYEVWTSKKGHHGRSHCDQ
jgi:hypothetical protein